MLAALLLRGGEPVSADLLIQALWGKEAPPTAAKALYVHVSRLRRELGDAATRLRTEVTGYRLIVEPGELDADRFERGFDEGRALLAAGSAAQGASVLREALALWRAPALADLRYEAFVQPEITRLEELRTLALEERVEAELALGEHARLVGELEALIGEYPLRERLRGQHMLALYRAGRHADALAAYRQARTELDAELGLEPGPELRRLEQAILRHDAALAAPPNRASAAVPPPPPTPTFGSEEDLRRIAPVLESPGARLRTLAGPRRPATPDVPADTSQGSPPLASTIAFSPSRLPALPTRLLGRERDLEVIMDLLRDPHRRLVTVTGPGGVGKTSVAIAIAYRVQSALSDGVVFVDLAPVSDPGKVADTVLQAQGGTSEPGVGAGETLALLLAGKEQLLILDNFEHLLMAGPLLSQLLTGAPRLRLLVTSRTILNLRAEQRYVLEPLALPAAGTQATVGEVAATPATALFLERARARDPSLSLSTDNAVAVAAVCTRLGGLPLAIELAAARCTLLSPPEIARKLEPILTGLGAAARDAPDRQRSLRATLDWSYDLLDEAGQNAFAGVAVFAGGCTLDAAQRVTDASLDHIGELVAHSLLARTTATDSDTRLVMLEPVREYALERLTSRPDTDSIHDRHSRYFIEFAETAGRDLRGPDQLNSRRRLARDTDNVRAALAREHAAGNVERVLRLAAALEFWWHDRVLWSEGRAWIEPALAAAPEDLPTQLRAHGLRVLALLAARQTDFEYALTRADQALVLHRALDDRAGAARCLAILAFVQRRLGSRDAAAAAAAEAADLARKADAWTRAVAVAAQADNARDLASATNLTRRAAALFERTGDQWGLSWMWRNLGSVALANGATDEANRRFEQALEAAKQIDDPIQAVLALGHRAHVALLSGDDASAAASYGEALTHCRRHGLRRPARDLLLGLSKITARRGDPRRAAELARAATALGSGRPRTGSPRGHTPDIRPAALDKLSTVATEHEETPEPRREMEQTRVLEAVTLGIETAIRYTDARAHAPTDSGSRPR